MTPFRPAAASALIALALVSTAHADAGRTVPANKVFPFLEAFLKVPAAERARLKVTYGLLHEGKPAAGLRGTLIETNGARTAISTDANGRFDRTPTLAQLQGNAQLLLDVPADTKFGASMQLEPVLKPAMAYDVRELEATVGESNAAIRKAAGAMAMMAPQMTGLVFPKAESGVAVFPNGSTQPLPARQGDVVFRSGEFKGATRVRLAKPPSTVDFYDKKK